MIWASCKVGIMVD